MIAKSLQSLKANRLPQSLTPSLFTRMMSGTSQDRRLEGKVAIVTASSDGIGLAIAERLGMDGAKVMVSSRKKEKVSSAVAQLKSKGVICEGVPCHVGSSSDRQALVGSTIETFGGIDILVSNAAANPHMGSVLECGEEAWDKIFDVNVKSALMLTQLCVPHMIDRNGGSIVYVTSIAGYVPINLLGAYSVSKTALLGLTKVVAAAVSDDNIRVNGVAPGIIKTKFSSSLWANETIAEQTLEQVPLRRFGESKDIAGVTAFLCSDDAAYVTGETIVAAGGMSSHL